MHQIFLAAGRKLSDIHIIFFMASIICFRYLESRGYSLHARLWFRPLPRFYAIIYIFLHIKNYLFSIIEANDSETLTMIMDCNYIVSINLYSL